MTADDVPSARRVLTRELAAVLAGCIVIAAAVSLLMVAWSPSNPAAGTDPDHYGLVTEDGRATRWTMQTPLTTADVGTTTRRLSGPQAASQWPAEAKDGLFVLEGGADEGPRQSFVAMETVITTVADIGDPVRDRVFTLAGSEGIHLVARTLNGDATVHALDPPLQLRPADLTVGTSWEGEGSFGVAGTYRYRAEVMSQEPVTGALGQFTDCLVIEERFEFSLGNQEPAGDDELTSICEGLGEVRRAAPAADRHSDLVVTTDLPDTPVPPMMQPAADGTPAQHNAVSGDFRDWELAVVGSVEGVGLSAGPNFAPAVIAGEEPRLVGQGGGGPLVALDGSDDATGAQWRFHPGQNRGGSLATSPDGRVVVLGTTARRVYALDANGVLLWSKRARDAVTGVAPDDAGGAIFVSEDRTVRAVDPDGRERWSIATGGPVTARPGVAADRVVVAGEDGAIRLLDVASGNALMRVDLAEAVTADVTVGPQLALVGTRDGLLVALELPNGTVRWRTRLEGEITTAAEAIDDRVVVVAAGRVVALDAEDGSVVAQSAARDFIGPPTPVEGGLLVTTAGGAVALVGTDGAVRRTWTSEAADTEFVHGVVLGSDGAWMADGDGRLYRLGTRRVGDRPAAVQRWSVDLGEPAFLASGTVPAYPAVPSPDGTAVLLDALGGVHVAEPESGEINFLGHVDGVADPAGGGIVHDGVLVIGTRDSLHAVRYPQLEPLWSLAGLGGSAGPPTVHGDTVFWVTVGPPQPGGVGAPGRLHAVDLHTGALRWESQPSQAFVATGVVVLGDTVLAGHDLAAYDIATGRQLWAAEDPGVGIGVPGRSPDGRHVAVTALTLPGTDPRLLLLDAETGTMRQVIELPGSYPDPSDAVRWVNGDVVASLLNGGIAAYSTDGSLRWSFTPPIARFGDLGLVNTQFWMELADGRVLVVDAESGQLLARDVVGDEQLNVNRATARPVEVGGHVLIADGRRVRAYIGPGGGQ